MAQAPARRAFRPAVTPSETGALSELLDVVVPDPVCAETPPDALDAAITPTERFFVRNHFPVPTINPAAWRLTIDGAVERPVELDLEALRARPSRTVVATLECAGNSRRAMYPPAEGVPWKHGAIGTAEWRGPSLGELLRSAGIHPSAREVLLEGADRGREPGVEGEIPYAMSVPLDKALDEDTLLALTMNGEALEPQHGFPVRALVPGWFGMASVKWINRISLLEQPFQGFYRTEAYVLVPEGPDTGEPPTPVTRLQLKSLITWPTEGAQLPPGQYTIRGAAWSGDAPVARVELTTAPAHAPELSDRWRPARLKDRGSRYAWVRWECPLDLPQEGHYVLRVRATDEMGHVQPLRAAWNYRGMATNSVHAVRVTVTSNP